MRVWRICSEQYAAEALTGRGGLVVSGRWHSRGRLIVYTSESRALCALETLVHVDKDLAPSDLVCIEIGVPDRLETETVDPSDLPDDWDAIPGPPALQAYGDDWLDSNSSPVLRVPSAVIHGEHNYLLNPGHPDARHFEVVSMDGFSFDSRLAR